MTNIKEIEEKIREKLKTTESVPLIYTDPSDDFRMYHGAEAKFDPSWMRCYIANPIIKKKE